MLCLMQVSYADCCEIVAACQSARVILAVCHVLRYTPQACKIAELIWSGCIGDVVNIQHTEPASSRVIFNLRSSCSIWNYHSRSHGIGKAVLFLIVKKWVCVYVSVCRHDDSWTIWCMIVKFVREQDAVKSSHEGKNGCIPIDALWCAGGDLVSLTFCLFIVLGCTFAESLLQIECRCITELILFSPQWFIVPLPHASLM